MRDFVIELFSPDKSWSVVIDHEFEVCYAYLKRQGKMMAHVWLFNDGTAPEMAAHLEHGAEPPFKNPASFVKEVDIPFPVVETDFSVAWFDDDLRVAEIRLREEKFAVFERGHRVGRSALCSAESKLARPMDE